jgi:hypothetical protein
MNPSRDVEVSDNQHENHVDACKARSLNVLIEDVDVLDGR